MRNASLVAFTLLSLTFTSIALAASGKPEIAVGENLVLLELFTSQGCSSCPSADQTLSRLAADPSLSGKILPLAFHVDYWNRLGWSDPFSLSFWSARQSRYSQIFKLGRVYTPQIVVQGTAQLVGSQESAIRSQVKAQRTQSMPTRITLARTAAADVVALTYRIDLAPSIPRQNVDLLMAIFENDNITSVKRGENGGRSLRNDFVVRRLEKVALPETFSQQGNARIVIDKSWKRASLGVAIFLQDRNTGRVYSASSIRL